MSERRLTNHGTKLFATALTAATFAMGGTAEASNACPSPNRIKNVSTQCHSFLINTLRRAHFDDVNESLAVTTYQELSPNHLAVDGDLGPNTAKSILHGEGLYTASPDPHSRQKELYIDKSDQVMFSLKRGNIKHIFSISSGSDIPYSVIDKKGHLQEGKAHTPTGVYRIKSIKGSDYEAPLGPMPYARFYDTQRGIAVHSGFVDTNGRDSHGCVRVDNSTMVRYIVPGFTIGNVVKVVN